MPGCDYPKCASEGEQISRLSPEGYLVATGSKAYSFREAYKRFHYCKEHHDELMVSVWNRVRESEDRATIMSLPLRYDAVGSSNRH